MFLDERHARPQTRRGGGAHQASRAAAYHHEVVSPLRARIAPVGGMRAGKQFPIGGIAEIAATIVS